MQIFLIIVYEINKLLGKPSDPLYKNKKNTFLNIDSYTNRYTIVSNLYLNNISIENIRKIL
jgi:hypothetical protein